MWQTSNLLDFYNCGQTVKQNNDDLDINIDAPGFRPEDIRVTLNKNLLEITGKKDKRSLSKAYELAFTPKKVEASLSYGVLNLKLLKPDYAKPKEIKVVEA